MIFQGDLIIRTAIELGIEDMKKNPWLIQDMLSDLMSNPYLTAKYGQKQIDACKEWFANNNIEINMAHRNDREKYPSITIAMGSSNEKNDMKSMADQSTESQVLMPKEIGRPIPYIVKPFTPDAYDSATGELVIPSSVDTSGVVAGQILVNPANGNGYAILDVTPEGIMLEDNLAIVGSKFGIVPAFPFYKARREHSFFAESYEIGCFVHGDPNAMLWLWSIVVYSLARYRESLLEACGFAESTISSGGLNIAGEASTPGGEQIWNRTVTIAGQVENSWLKSPRRYIENVELKKKTKDGYLGGIIILSNEDSPAEIDKSQEAWYTEEEDD